MLLPYASDFVPKRKAWVTTALIALLMIMVVLCVENDRLKLLWAGRQLFANYGILPARFEPHTLMTYIFLHDGYSHALVNCFYLWVFGAAVEAATGRLRYLILFLAAGILGGLLQWLVTVTLLSPEMARIPIVGASAACAGLAGLFAVRYYRARLAFIGLPFKPHVVSVIGLFLAYEILSGLLSLGMGNVQGGVAHWAHIGGFVFGLGMAYLLRLSDEGRMEYLQDDAGRAMETSQPGAAIKRWQMVLNKDPNNSDAQRELARAWHLLGDNEQASGYFLQATRLMLKQNKRDNAGATFAEMFLAGMKEVSHSGKNIRLTVVELSKLAAVLEEHERYDMAVAVLKELISQHPQSQESEPAIAKVAQLSLDRLHKKEDAQIYLRLFLERFPHSQWRPFIDGLQARLGMADSDSSPRS